MDCGELGVWYGSEGRSQNLRRKPVGKGETGLSHLTASSAMGKHALGTLEPTTLRSGKESASASKYATLTTTGTEQAGVCMEVP